MEHKFNFAIDYTRYLHVDSVSKLQNNQSLISLPVQKF